jgi:DNA-binding Xre family transcriptional regulator
LARRNERCGIGAGRCFPKLQQKSDEAAAVEERFHKIWSKGTNAADEYNTFRDCFYSGSSSASLSPDLLAEKNLTVADLHQILRKRGFEVNKKTLYRLATSQPIQKLDTSIMRAVCEALEVRLQDLIQFQKPKFELKHLDPQSQKELNRLMDKNNQGELTKTEQARFKALLDEVQRISLYNAKALLNQKRLRESTSREVLAAR